MSEGNTPHVSVEYDGSSVHYYSIEYNGHADDTTSDTTDVMSEESLVDDLPASMDFEVMAFGGQATVCATAPKQGRRSTAYQSEAELEKAFIAQLQRQAYEYVTFSTEAELVANLRHQLELLNGFTFTDKEWQRFFKGCIASENEGIVEKTRRIQRDHVQVLHRDDGTVKNVQLIDKRNVHNNRLQVMNQYAQTGTYDNRYDVTILVNGLPLVHVELKRRGVAIKEAFNQIERYQRDSFWSGCGLYEYVQIFVISNGTHTKYYSNTTRWSHIEESKGKKKSGKKTSNSFEFTSWWADADNVPIYDLVPFTSSFFAKHAILNILTRYCVFDVDERLLVMRPYQIVATERILNRILPNRPVFVYDIPVREDEISEAQIRAWADEAEAGYDVEALKRRGRGRPGRGAQPMQVVAVRLSADEIAALDAVVARERVTRSEVIRRALAQFAA